MNIIHQTLISDEDEIGTIYDTLVNEKSKLGRRQDETEIPLDKQG